MNPEWEQGATKLSTIVKVREYIANHFATWRELLDVPSNVTLIDSDSDVL